MTIATTEGWNNHILPLTLKEKVPKHLMNRPNVHHSQNHRISDGGHQEESNQFNKFTFSHNKFVLSCIVKNIYIYTFSSTPKLLLLKKELDRY